MRLLDARTFQFREVNDPRIIPKYAILSHTWTDNKVVYPDLISSPQRAQQRPEFAKVKFTAQQALDNGLDYIWVDTCNIDKSSSAELSETINSMYMLYKKAEVCYAYLEDVHEVPPAGWTDDGQDGDAWTETFIHARWFTRGWTLQELIAPRSVIFYTSDWRYIGTKQELCQTIARNTGMPSTILLNLDRLRDTSVAERMSWAANRTTTRVEDQAYCLLGLFDIYMPLLYGEGERAFLRLQHEIIKTTNDRSIFLWTAREESHTSFRNLFARSPAEFALFNDYDLDATYGRFEVTQSGLEIRLPLLEAGMQDEFFGVVVIAGEGFLCVRLRKIGPDGEYARVDADRIFRIINPGYNPFAGEYPRPESSLIAIPNTFDNLSYEIVHFDHRLAGFYVEYYPVELQIHRVEPSYAWNEEAKILELDFSKNVKPLDDGLKIAFSETLYPDTVFEVDLLDEIRDHCSFKTIGHSRSNQKYGYVQRMKNRFIGDKMMIVIRISYIIQGDSKWEANVPFGGSVF